MNFEPVAGRVPRITSTPPGLVPSAVGGPSVGGVQGVCTPKISDFRRCARPSKHRFHVLLTGLDSSRTAHNDLTPDEVCFLVIDSLDSGDFLGCMVEVAK